MHTIPPRYRADLGGKPAFVRSTGESDKARAQVIAAGYEQEWRARIESVKRNYKGYDARIKSLLASGADPVFASLDAIDVIVDATPPAPKVERIAFGTYIVDWLKISSGTDKSKHMKRVTATKFGADFVYISDVHRQAVQKWVNTQIEGGASVSTVKRALSELRGYWSYLVSLGLAPEEQEPFLKLITPKAEKDTRRAFASEDVVILVRQAEKRNDNELADVIRIAAYTGCRIEEICTLRCEDIDDTKITVHGTKTRAAMRQVPVHPELAPTLKRLKGKRSSGYLFKDMKLNKFGDRSNAVGKRFGKMKMAEPLNYGSEYVFHSIRKTFTTLLWSSGIQRELISQILGHETGHITTDIYARDPDFETKRRAIAAVQYPAQL
ncbi:putative Integrase [Magnetospirillum sp. LM-5]|nr:putative Integrase [Magnetospirillum sp. LM-5]